MPDGPPGRPVSRLGDADRDRLTAVLREHYALGRLDLDELSRRVGIVLAADHADEAAVALHDLPPLDVPGVTRRVRRRHGQTAAPGDGWVPTSERFRDPATGTIMRVWLDPADQSRHYVPEAGT